MSNKGFARASLVLGLTMLLTACFGPAGYYYERPYVDRKYQQAFSYHLPNLIVKQTRIFVRDDEVIIQPRVENIGNKAAGAFNVQVRYQMEDNDGVIHPIGDLGTNPWAPLGAGQDRRQDHNPTISIEDLPTPILLGVYVFVDTPLETGGQVRESNETDNRREDVMYIY